MRVNFVPRNLQAADKTAAPNGVLITGVYCIWVPGMGKVVGNTPPLW